MPPESHIERSAQNRSGNPAADRDRACVQLLLIEDNRGDARLLAELLRGARTRFEVTTCGSLAEAFASEAGESCDLVLADLGLPDSDGLDTFFACRAHWIDTPIVVLSGLGDELVAEDAVRAGAQDYLVKGEIDGQLLQRALHYAIDRHGAAEERRAFTRELEASRKLEAVGQLAAGVAHEINTPVHYVTDNLRFVQHGMRRVGDLLDTLTVCLRAGQPLDGDALNRLVAEADLDYLREELPRCLEQSLQGLGQIARISGAMGELAHPGVGPDLEFVPTDLNRILEGVIAVAACEWRGITELSTSLDPALPAVACLPGELNQAFLNLLVNASQAVELHHNAAREEGSARVHLSSVCLNDDWVEVRVEDTGPGVPDRLKSKIFEPFFTTKQVGAGTGQGLAIAHRVVVSRHGGTIHVEDAERGGAVFCVRLPRKRTASSASDQPEN
ncbi:MAG: hypothetical protein DHS20C15_09120 [Planctomycetota bacterium]|nr:MAG: hypothetical protein DHS20C15_09120 [Planctomycetota bacterium]